MAKNLISIKPSELRFRTSRSGGPGGQNVNKLETRVELLFDVSQSPSLTEEQRATIMEKLANMIDSRGRLRIVVQEARSQRQNKERAIEKLSMIVHKALARPKERIPTKPSKATQEKRLQAKKLRSRRKQERRPHME